MKTRIAGRLETAVGANFGPLCGLSGLDLNLRSKSVAVRLAADGPDSQPVPTLRALVFEEHGRPVELGHQQILVAVIHEIGCRRTAGHVTAVQGRARPGSDFFEL